MYFWTQDPLEEYLGDQRELVRSDNLDIVLFGYNEHHTYAKQVSCTSGNTRNRHNKKNHGKT